MSTKNEGKSTKSTGGRGKSSNVWTDEEKAAMKERAKELKAEERMNKDRAAGESAVVAAIAALKGSDRTLGKRLHELVKENAPALMPKTWYGMPAYARDGEVVFFFQPAGKFKTRYATIGFNDSANLDEGDMWPVGFALIELTPAGEAKVAALIKKAVR
jgi:uncharacterized protein YdhG (YjbR/CyaY superfamily)